MNNIKNNNNNINNINNNKTNIMDSFCDDNSNITISNNNNNKADTSDKTSLLVAESGCCDDGTGAENILFDIKVLKNKISKDILLLKEIYKKLFKMVLNILNNNNSNNNNKNDIITDDVSNNGIFLLKNIDFMENIFIYDSFGLKNNNNNNSNNRTETK